MDRKQRIATLQRISEFEPVSVHTGNAEADKLVLQREKGSYETAKFAMPIVTSLQEELALFKRQSGNSYVKALDAVSKLVDKNEKLTAENASLKEQLLEMKSFSEGLQLGADSVRAERDRLKEENEKLSEKVKTAQGFLWHIVNFFDLAESAKNLVQGALDELNKEEA